MKIIFNRIEIADHAISDDPNNTSEALISRRENMLKILGEFMGADSVEYIDHGNSEEYRIVKGEKRLRLSALGNKIDGGWLAVERDEMR